MCWTQGIDDSKKAGLTEQDILFILFVHTFCFLFCSSLTVPRKIAPLSQHFPGSLASLAVQPKRNINWIKWEERSGHISSILSLLQKHMLGNFWIPWLAFPLSKPTSKMLICTNFCNIFSNSFPSVLEVVKVSWCGSCPNTNHPLLF